MTPSYFSPRKERAFLDCLFLTSHQKPIPTEPSMLHRCDSLVDCWYLGLGDHVDKMLWEISNFKSLLIHSPFLYLWSREGPHFSLSYDSVSLNKSVWEQGDEIIRIANEWQIGYGLKFCKKKKHEFLPWNQTNCCDGLLRKRMDSILCFGFRSLSFQFLYFFEKKSPGDDAHFGKCVLDLPPNFQEN